MRQPDKGSIWVRFLTVVIYWRKQMSKYQIISEDPKVQERYVASRKAGSSHKLAEMLALAQPAPYHNLLSPLHPRKTRGRGH